MSRPTDAQPFAPASTEIQYEAPHGLLKLRGGHDQPGTSAYPELDEKGVSTPYHCPISSVYVAYEHSSLSSRTSCLRKRRTSMSTGCTSGSNRLEKDLTETIDLPGDHSIYLLSQSEYNRTRLYLILLWPESLTCAKGEVCSTVMVLVKNSSAGISDPSLN